MTVTFNATHYVASHGKSPKGRGSWMFQVQGSDTIYTCNGTYTEAKKAAKAKVTARYATLIVLP